MIKNNRISFNKIIHFCIVTIVLSVLAACGSGGGSGTAPVTVPPAVSAQWAQTVTAASNISGFTRVSVASNGSVYAAGYIDGTGTYNFGNSVTAAGTSSGDNIVLVKYNSSGVAQWAQTVTAGSDNSLFYDVSVSSDGSVYAAGHIRGTDAYNFGNSVTATGASSGDNIILVKYNSSGVAQWAQTVTAASDQSGFYGVSVASDGSVYAVGFITGTYNFGNGVTATGISSGFNIILVKYNSSGVAQWAQTVAAGSDDSWFGSVSVASDGSVYAVGYIKTGTYNFGNGATAVGAYNGYNLILVKYNSSGVAQRAQTVTTANNISEFYGVSVASDGSIYAAGDIFGTGTYNFGNGVTTSGTSSDSNIVLVKYDSSGVAQWAQTITAGSNGSVFTGVSVASDGSVYAAGFILGTGTYNFGNGVTAAGTYGVENIILVKYNSSGVAQWAQTVTAGSDSSGFNSVSVASDGSVYAAGIIYKTGTYSFGNSVTAAGIYSGGESIILVKYD